MFPGLQPGRGTAQTARLRQRLQAVVSSYLHCRMDAAWSLLCRHNISLLSSACILSFSIVLGPQITEARLCLQGHPPGALRRELSQESLQHGSRSAVSLSTASSGEEAAGAAGSRGSSQPPSPALQQTRGAAQRPAGGDSSLLAALPAGVPVEGGLAPAEMAQLMAMVERLEEELFSSETMRNEVEVGRPRFAWVALAPAAA